MKKLLGYRLVQNARNYAVSHKIISGAVALIVIFGGYFIIKNITGSSVQPRYIISTVQTGTIIATVTGSGQVSASNQIDIKPKVSGQIVWVGAKPGDVIRAGYALMSIDNTTAKQSVINAEQTLITAQLQYKKDEASAPIDYQTAQDNLTNAQNNLVTTYNDAFNTLSSTYLDLPNIMTGSNNILYGYDLSTALRNVSMSTPSTKFSELLTSQ